MSILSLTYQQSVFKRYHSDQHFSEFLPTRWQQKSIGIDTEQNYVTVTLCILPQGLAHFYDSFLRYFHKIHLSKNVFKFHEEN